MKVRELIIRWGFEIDDKPLLQLERNIAGVKSIARTTTIAFAAISAGVGYLLNQAGKFEQWQIAFETMLGSTEKAGKLLEQLKKFTLETPFQMPQVVEGAKALMAFGFEADNIIPTLKMLGDISAGLGVDISRMILNLGQVRAQTKLTGRELRDFAIMGVPLIPELAKLLNVAEKSIADMVSRGEIGFDVVMQAFTNMTSAGGRFNNLMLRQMNSLFGIISNVKDMIIQMAISLGSKLLPKAKEITRQFLNFLTVNKDLIELRLLNVINILVKYFDKFVKIITVLSVSLKGIVKLFGGLENSIKLVTYARLGMLAIRYISAMGSIIQVVYLMIESYTKLGNAALIAQAKMVALPFIIGSAFVALGLIIEDIVAYFQGRKSLFGLIVEKFNKLSPALKGVVSLFMPFIPILEDIKKYFEGKESITGKIIEFAKSMIFFVNLIMKPLILLHDMILAISKLVSAFFQLPSMTARMAKDIVPDLGSIIKGLLPEGGMDALKNLSVGGFPDLFNPANLLTAGAGTTGANQPIYNINLNNKIDVNVPPETPPELAGSKIKEGTTEAIRNLLKNTNNLIEDQGE